MTEISRRKFIQLSVIGSAVAATGCRPLTRYNPGLYRAEVTGTYGGYDNRVYPYVNQPDGFIDGVPQYFATVCQMCSAGCGLMVRTMSGRAIKIEGNPAHPVNLGKTCARGQAALQHLYNPDRLRQPLFHDKRGATFTRDRDKDANPPDGREQITEVASTSTDWETALGKITAGLKSAAGRIAILADAQEFSHSPTSARLVNEFAAKVGAKVYAYSLLDDAPWRAASKAVYGRDQLPAYQLDEADVIVSFGGDFLEAWPSPVYYSRLFGDFRQGPRRAQGEHGKFIYVGPRMSMTAAKADLWLPCNPSTEAVVASALRAALGGYGISVSQNTTGLTEVQIQSLADTFRSAATASGLTEAQLQSLVDTFRAAGARAVAVGGNGLMSSTNPTAAFTTVEALNAQVKSQCVGFGTAAVASPTFTASGLSGIKQLTQAMQLGQVGALLILGQPNPVFTLPTSVGFTAALAKVPLIAALTTFEDETTAYADVVLPTRSFLEEWGDHVPPVIPPNTRLATLRQPIIDPQFVGGHGQVQDNENAFVPWWDTRPTGELLLDLAKRLGKPLADADTHSAVRKTWAGLGQANLQADSTENDPKWVNALATGGMWTVGGPPAPNSGGVGIGKAGVARNKPGELSLFGYGAGVPSESILERALSVTIPAPQNWGGGATFALQLYPGIYNHDGRHANLGWMQENPDPMTMAVWNSWVEINMQVAHEMGIRTGDTVRLTSASGLYVDALAVPYPGMHPGAVAMPIGQGHSVYGRNAMGRGTNPMSILDPTADSTTGAFAYGATRVKLTKLASAKHGYYPDNTTLVLAQDRPGGVEPEAVKDLIHTTAKEWKTAKKVQGTPQGEGSMFKRGSDTGKKPGE